MAEERTLAPALPFGAYSVSLREAALEGWILASVVDFYAPLWHLVLTPPSAFNVVSAATPIDKFLSDVALLDAQRPLTDPQTWLARRVAFVEGEVIATNRNREPSDRLELTEGVTLHLPNSPGSRMPTGPGTSVRMEVGDHVIAAVSITDPTYPQYAGNLFFWMRSETPVVIPDYGFSPGACLTRGHLVELVTHNLKLDLIPHDLHAQVRDDMRRVHSREPGEDLNPDRQAEDRLCETVSRYYGPAMVPSQQH